MIRISYPKEKITKLGLETKAYCIKLSSAKFDVISLVDKILTHLDEETEFYYRATGTYSELNDLSENIQRFPLILVPPRISRCLAHETFPSIPRRYHD